MNSIRTHADLQDVLSLDRAVLYKHSTRCELSISARRHVEQFADNFPVAQVFLVDVLRDRSLSDEVEELLGVRHESPQAILLEGGKAVRHAS
ncbi:MAG: thioredoxin family protein, partial [Gemmatimonadota bacterium]|nr:thioredoxin family protein [Gemmatimonadota bacterium]